MYFHVSYTSHGVGTILYPGRFGTYLRDIRYGAYSENADHFRFALIEMALETARLALAPEAPSRLNCIFIADTLQFAEVFRDQYRPGATIFSVQPEGEAFEPRVCNYDLITRPRSGAPPFFGYMPEEAVKYWTDPVPTGDFPELLYPGPLRVVGIAA